MRLNQMVTTMRRSSRMLPEAATMLVLLAAVWTGMVSFAAWDQQEEQASALAEARRMTLAFRESIAQRTDDIDNTLRLLRSARASGSADAVLAAMARAGADGPVFQVAYITADGRL